MLLLADPAVARVPVQDSGEALVDVRDASDLPLDHRKAGPDGSWARLRQGVLDRLVLGSALTRAGLVNYPPEWWHWSYGDRYWAVVTGAPVAIHAPV